MNPQKTSGVIIGPAGGTRPKTCKLYDYDDGGGGGGGGGGGADADDNDDDNSNNNNNNLTKINLTPEQNLIARRGVEV